MAAARRSRPPELRLARRLPLRPHVNDSAVDQARADITNRDDPGDDDEPGRERAPSAPVSGVRTRQAPRAIRALRALARKAEWLSLEALAFELFFAAARIESSGDLGRVRGQIAELAASFTGVEARFYRRALHALASAPDR